MSPPAALLLGASLVGGPALAARPTDLVGAYSFEAEDVVESIDGAQGLVRVHYSVSGPNQTVLDDDDSDGVPDLPQQVALTAEDVLLTYAAAGLRLPLHESELGLQPLGGSDALDFYLVDFGGVGDGQFAVDACAGGVCSGYMMIENDYAGYGYGSLAYAVKVLTSHELFHGVQYAYTDDVPGWMSEGTAMWGEFLYDPDSPDFLGWCGRYLEEPERSLYNPPAGAFTGWEYGTGLYFAFLDLALGPETVVDLLEELGARGGGDADLEALVAAIEGRGSTLEESWVEFATWNLATGRHAGELESYPFAASLDEVAVSREGETLVDDERVYPLASVYLRLDHPGGPLQMAIPDEATGLYVAVHPGEERGPTGPAVATWWPEGSGDHVDFGELEAGSWYVLLSQPGLGDGGSIAIDYCLGDAETLEACGLAGEDTGDTGGAPVEEPGGCACAAGGAGAWPWASLLPLGLALARRRQSQRPSSHATIRG